MSEAVVLHTGPAVESLVFRGSEQTSCLEKYVQWPHQEVKSRASQRLGHMDSWSHHEKTLASSVREAGTHGMARAGHDLWFNRLPPTVK